MGNLKLWELVLTLLKFNRSFFFFPIILTSVCLLIVGVEGFCCTWSHSVTSTHLVGLLWMRDNTILKRDRLSCYWQDSNLQSQQASGSDRRLRPCGHWDRPVHHHLYKCTVKEFRVQKQVVDLVSRCRTRSMNWDLKYSNGSVATRKFQSLVHTFGERMKSEWAKDTFVWL